MKPLTLPSSNTVLPKRPGINPSYALGRLSAGQMNQTEARYAALLEGRKLAGEVAWWSFEALTFKLAADTRYTPDFTVMLASGELEAHEVKGYVQDDSLVKIKVAARLFPMRFYLIFARKKSEGGGWDINEVQA